MRSALLACAAWCLVSAVALAQGANEVHSDDFESGMDRWEPFGGQPSFAIVEVIGPAGSMTHALRALGNSTYEPQYRSPPNIAMLKDVTVGDFELTVSVQSTRPTAGPHRDMIVVWGYQNPNQFYYVHLGAVSDPTSGQIFVVDNAARTAITLPGATGTPWTNGWFDVKVTRNVATGAMNVYFGNLATPFMSANDDRFEWGRVGLGTFDDHGNWDNFQLTASAVADFNGNGVVNAQDLSAWRLGFGAGSSATRASGDGNGDGRVDGTDFLIWQRQLTTLALESAASYPAPEPSSAWLLSMATAAIAVSRRQRG